MPIETDFTFNQAHPAGAVAEFATPVEFRTPFAALSEVSPPSSRSAPGEDGAST